MNYFRGKVQGGEIVKMKINSRCVNILNIGAEDLFIKFSELEDGEGLLIPSNVLSRSFKFEYPLKNIYVKSENDTTLQVDGLCGGAVVAMPGINSGPVVAPEPEGPVEVVESPYFPLPNYNDAGEIYDNFVVTHTGPFYELYYFNGDLLKEGDSYGNTSENSNYSQSGFENEWSTGYGTSSISIYTGNGGKILAVGKDIKERTSGKVVRKSSIFATLNDNKRVENFYPQPYLNFPLNGFSTWVIYKVGGGVNLAYVNGFLEHDGAVLKSSEIGFKKFSFVEGVYTETENNSSVAFSTEIDLKDVLETGFDITGNDLTVKKHRTALKVVN